MKLTESRLLHGNSLEILESLPDKHFDLLLADPPYEISRSSNVKSMGRSGLDFGEWDKEFDQYTWIKKAIPKLKPGASIVIWNDWKKLQPEQILNLKLTVGHLKVVPALLY